MEGNARGVGKCGTTAEDIQDVAVQRRIFQLLDHGANVRAVIKRPNSDEVSVRMVVEGSFKAWMLPGRPEVYQELVESLDKAERADAARRNFFSRDRS